MAIISRSLPSKPADESLMKKVNVKLDKYPKVDLLRSKNVQTANAASRYIGVLGQEHLNWIDWTEVFFALQGMKAERGWYNLELRLEDLKYLMANPSWYELSIPEDRLNFHDFGKNVELWQDVTISLLRGYMDMAYKKAKSKEEQKHLKETRVTYYNIGMPDEYEIEVRNDLYNVVDYLKTLQAQVEANEFGEDLVLDALISRH